MLTTVKFDEIKTIVVKQNPNITLTLNKDPKNVLVSLLRVVTF